MKNKMIYALGAMMLVGVTSCDLTEKPSSFYEKDTYFVTEGKAQMAVVGIYDCLERCFCRCIVWFTRRKRRNPHYD